MHFLQATNCFVLASALALAVPACTPAQDLPHAASADDGGIDADHDDDADVTRHEGGIDSDADVAIGTGGPIAPIVFFAAHPDDETIGMAGAILQAISEGRPVYIELMTHGEASFVRGVLENRGTDAWHPGPHVYALSVQEFGDARVREFHDAMSRLGVTGVHVSAFGNGTLTPAQVTERIDYWLGQNIRGLSLRGTAGAQDPGSATNPAPHPDHAAVWNALAASGYPDVLGYCIYQAVTGKCSYDAKIDVGPWCKGKRDALAAYELWEPLERRYGIAFHSTNGLLTLSGTQCEEYVVRPGPAPRVPVDDDGTGRGVVADPSLEP
jgi:LmbE family N-acetylglucosaminyl deacetylase